MKSLFLLPLVLFYGQLSFAHGDMFEQAEGVTATCLKYMKATEPTNTIRRFQSVATAVSAVEIFTVTVTLNDGRIFEYNGVGKDEPEFHWECTRVN